MKKFKRILALMLALIMTVSLAACGDNNSKDEPDKELTYDELSSKLYEENLGEFYALYKKAKEAKSDSERYALMALAEAKLMESAIFVPTNTEGGVYAISRVVPKTANYALWGNDSSRLHGVMVVDDLLKGEDRDALKGMWNELKGTGTYRTKAIEYLTEKGYTLKDSYNMAYVGDPDTWDIFDSDLSAVSEVLVNTFDGLLEYDCEATQQPALAESYTVSEDGLTYTFKLREGVKWVDSQGREVGEVVADDFVAGMQHMMDAMAGLEYLVQDIIVGADAYINDETDDFSTVGVKAVDKYTVEYTLTEPTSYFITMVGYSIFAPLCREYYTSKGGKFGAEYDPAATDYLYGKDANSIAYCGPYLVTSFVAENTIVFKANEKYWNKDNVTLKTITWLYADGSDPTKTYTDTKAGTIDGASLNTSTIELAKADGIFDDYHYISDTTAGTFNFFFNINRVAYANANDTTKVVSSQTDADKERTQAALQNVHFRRAVAFSIDKKAYNAQGYGDTVAEFSLRNSYTPWNFVYLEEDVTVDINGTETTFEAGTPYGEIMQAQIDADGVKIVVYDPEADNGNGSGDGYDGWYNKENAAAELALAVEELKAQGVEISAENPIKIDLPYPSNSATYTNMANVVKQAVAEATNGMVEVSLVSCADYMEWYYTAYYITDGKEANHDLTNVSGWIPDYGDPSSYLDTILPDYEGAVTKMLGMF